MSIPVNLDVIVVGAGHAGMASSYYLKKAGLSHVVLERDRIGESWRSQRWDSFYLNTPNWCSHLPGDEYAGDSPEAFYHRDDFVEILESYARRFELPIEEKTEVIRLRPISDGYEITYSMSSGASASTRSASVIVASGIQNVPWIPEASKEVPASIHQIHAADYDSPDGLPDGSVLVVGGGQSGLQITEDLLESNRRVYLSSSRVGRVPRRYRGRDILEWMRDVGIMDQKVSELEDPDVRFETVPHLSGVGPLGHTVSYQQLARLGATIVGRVTGFRGGVFETADDAHQNIRFADEKSAEIKQAIDKLLEATSDEPLAIEPDPNDEPDPDCACASQLTRLDPDELNIRSVVWCTGFRGSFDWIEAPLQTERGRPVHSDGVSALPGLYFVGFPWLRTRKSGIITGTGDDAAYVVSQIVSRE